MTTDAAAELYLAEHRHQWAGKGAAFFNPHGTNMNNLPVIYGFNNGGTPGMYHGMILAEDGTFLGEIGCSKEGYMLADLGILDGSRPDFHERFKQHYPDGYRMVFVTHEGVPMNHRLQDAIKLYHEKNKAKANA